MLEIPPREPVVYIKFPVSLIEVVIGIVFLQLQVVELIQLWAAQMIPNYPYGSSGLACLYQFSPGHFISWAALPKWRNIRFELKLPSDLQHQIERFTPAASARLAVGCDASRMSRLGEQPAKSGRLVGGL